MTLGFRGYIAKFIDVFQSAVALYLQVHDNDSNFRMYVTNRATVK